jgi:hypothetical protein
MPFPHSFFLLKAIQIEERETARCICREENRWCVENKPSRVKVEKYKVTKHSIDKDTGELKGKSKTRPSTSNTLMPLRVHRTEVSKGDEGTKTNVRCYNQKDCFDQKTRSFWWGGHHCHN